MHQYPESPDFFFILQRNLKIKRLVIGRLKKAQYCSIDHEYRIHFKPYNNSYFETI